MIKKKDSAKDRKNEKKVKAIEAEIMYQTIEKEKQERLAALHWIHYN